MAAKVSLCITDSVLHLVNRNFIAGGSASNGMQSKWKTSTAMGGPGASSPECRSRSCGVSSRQALGAHDVNKEWPHAGSAGSAPPLGLDLVPDDRRNVGTA